MPIRFFVVLISLFVFTAALGMCQGQTTRITVKDNHKTALAGATVQLIRMPDSVSTYRTTDANGIAEFEKCDNGLYQIIISFIGFETLEKGIAINSDKRNFNFQMKEKTTTLSEVTIAGRKPLIRQEDDKMIIDPEPMIAISTNTLEVLESTPGLFVDNEGGIYLSSATPAAIYINGREQKMSTQDVMTLLRNLPPGSVQRIEVLRTPSTKYDAASSGGIINIILKKGVKLGRFGTVNVGMNQGVYGNRFAGFSLNNSGEKSTMYLNLNYNYNDMEELLHSSRTLEPDTMLHQSAISRRKSNQLYMDYGISYDLSERLNFSYDGRISFGDHINISDNSNIIDTQNNLLLSESDNNTNNQFNALNIQQDLGLVRKFDTLGSELDTKFGLAYNSNISLQDYQSQYLSPFLFSLQGNGKNTQQRYFWQLQSDLTYNLPWKIKVETGLKTTWQDFSSNAGFTTLDFSTNTNIYDSLRTSAFNYQESINAFYAQASRTLGAQFVLKTGFRLEHTYMSGHQTIPADTSFLVNRIDWFPYIYLSRPIIKLMGIELTAYLIYRKTINRPGYQELNPYIKYNDPFLYESGNPNLKPQFTDNVEFNISFNDFPVFAIGQNRTRDIFSSVVYQDEQQENIAVMTYDNLGKSKETYLRGTAGIPPGGKYFFAIGGQYNLNEYDGFYQNQPFSYQRGSWRFFTFHSLTLFGETKIYLMGFLMVNGQQNFYELDNFGQLNASIIHTFFHKKLTISLHARDILRTMETKFKLDQGGIETYGSRYSDNQRFGINIRYNYGVKAKEERKGMPGFEQVQ